MTRQQRRQRERQRLWAKWTSPNGKPLVVGGEDGEKFSTTRKMRRQHVRNLVNGVYQRVQGETTT